MEIKFNAFSWFGVRHLQVLLITLQLATSFLCRNSVSVAVVAMTNTKTPNPDFPPFAWNEQVKSYILSSYTWGYTVTPMVGGFLSHYMGARKVMLIACVAGAIFVLITPLAIDWGGWPCYCCTRILQGFFQGLTFPAFNQHLSKWLARKEKNMFGGIVYCGIDLGNMLAMATSGFIAKSTMGWPGISYIFGGLAMVWVIFWWAFAANTPEESRWIGSAERSYLMENVEADKKKVPIPWLALITSAPIWALSMARAALLWATLSMDSYLPTYMNSVLNLDLHSNALFSALPYIATFICNIIGVFAMDLIIRKKWLSQNVFRKSIIMLGFCIPAMSFIGLGFLNEDYQTLVVAFFVINNVCLIIACTSILVNNYDLSPNHAGIIMGIQNTVGNLVALMAPITVGIVVNDETNVAEWQIVFSIIAALLIVSALVFLAWGSTKLQPWNDEQYLKKSAEH